MLVLLILSLIWIFYLLEPESDDGFVNWYFFDDFLIREINENGTAIFPVFKIF